MEPLHFDELEHGEEITLDRLAVMIGKGFAHNDTRFDASESQLDRIEHLLLAEQKREIEEQNVLIKSNLYRMEECRGPGEGTAPQLSGSPHRPGRGAPARSSSPGAWAVLSPLRGGPPAIAEFPVMRMRPADWAISAPLQALPAPRLVY
jgi:hypothetical protein